MILIAVAVIIIACNKREKVNPTSSNQQTIIAGQSQNSDIDATPGPVSFKPVTVQFCSELSSGSGICEMLLRVNNPQTGQPIVLGGFDKSTCNMVIQFVNYNNSSELDGADFTMTNDFTVPADVADALSGSSFIIKAGKFPIQKEGNKKIVEFPWCENVVNLDIFHKERMELLALSYDEQKVEFEKLSVAFKYGVWKDKWQQVKSLSWTTEQLQWIADAEAVLFPHFLFIMLQAITMKITSIILSQDW